MTEVDNLLVIVGEECAEIQQNVSKALRFGLRNHNPFDSSKSFNAMEILTEFYQLSSVIEELIEIKALPDLLDGEIEYIKREKKSKVKQWLKTSKREGRVE